MKLPSHGGKDRLNDLIYLSQILQAMAMKTQTELLLYLTVDKLFQF
jgi:hypothetical protein